MSVCNQHYRLGLKPRRRVCAFGIAATLFALSYCVAIPSARAEAANPSGPNAGTTLTPVEAQHALEVLQDAGKRDALIETLRTIAKAAPAAPPPTAAAAPSPVGMDGFGSEALQQLSAEMGDLSAQFEHSVRAVTKFPAMWRWLTSTATDPEAQGETFGFLWRGLAVAVLGLLAERLVRLALRRPFTALEGRAAHDHRGEAVATPDADQVDASSARRVWRLRMALGRAPYAVAHLILELAPIAAFAAAGNLLLTTSIGAEPVARVMILALVNAYVLLPDCDERAANGPLQFGARSEPFRLPAKTAAAIEAWLRRLIGVTVFGLAFANVARALGLQRSAYFAMVKLIVLVPHLLLVIVTLRYRRVVASFIRAPAGRAGLMALLRNRFAEVWAYAAIFANLALWAIWAFRIPNGYSLLAYYASEAIVIAVIARAIWAVAMGGLDRAFHPRSGFLACARFSICSPPATVPFCASRSRRSSRRSQWAPCWRHGASTP